MMKHSQVEEQHAATKVLLEVASRDRDIATGEVESHKQLVSELQSQISTHEETIKAHQESLQELQDSHAREIGEIKAASQQDYESQLAALQSEHAENIRALESELTETREDLMKVATQVAFALGLDVSVEMITERIDDLIADQKALAQEQKMRAELEGHVNDLTSINDTIMRDLEAAKSTMTEIISPDGEQMKSPYPSVTEQVALVKKKLSDLETRNKKNSRLVEELEDQLQTNFDQTQLTNNRLSTLQTERNAQLDDANAARVKLQSELDTIKEEYASLQVRTLLTNPPSIAANSQKAKFDSVIPADGPQRTNSMNSNLRKSASVASLPSPPPAIPLPPLPGGSSGGAAGQPTSPTGRPGSKDIAISQIQEDQEARIRTIEKHLHAEKQLTQTLEEALTDLEHQQNKIKADCDAWRRRCTDLETELKEIKEKPQDNRWSLHQVEEERKKRRDAEIARAHLEERMNAISKKKKKGSLNCF
jgi:kinesin family protein 4/21/27